jgi:hypothetical protein
MNFAVYMTNLFAFFFLYKPIVGMSFENIESAEQFYKNYAHENGFSVRVGQQISYS